MKIKRIGELLSMFTWEILQSLHGERVYEEGANK